MGANVVIINGSTNDLARKSMYRIWPDDVVNVHAHDLTDLQKKTKVRDKGVGIQYAGIKRVGTAGIRNVIYEELLQIWPQLEKSANDAVHDDSFHKTEAS